MLPVIKGFQIPAGVICLSVRHAELKLHHWEPAQEYKLFLETVQMNSTICSRIAIVKCNGNKSYDISPKNKVNRTVWLLRNLFCSFI